MRSLYRRIVLATALLLVGRAVGGLPLSAQPPPDATRILILYAPAPDSPTSAIFIERFRATVRSELPPPVEFFEEFLDLDRFPGPHRWPQLTRYFSDKYVGARPHLIVAVGSVALHYAVDQLRPIMPGAPIVFGMAYAHRVHVAALPENVTGRTIGVTLGTTLTMARRLQPDADRVVVIAGSSAVDSVAMSAALADVAGAPPGIPVVPWRGLPYDSLLAALRRLSPRTIVFFAHFRRDGTGRTLVPVEIVPQIARESGAPVYSYVDKLMGTGIVGGAMIRHDDEAARTGVLAARVLRREAGVGLPPVEATRPDFMVDWRALRRWNLDPGRLAGDTEVLFRTPTTWERHRGEIVLALGVIVGESLLIALLLIERRRRIRAALRAEEAGRQVAHMGRVAMIGELASTISHELRQPLAAIRINAEVGKKLIARREIDVLEVARIFDDIVADDVRASGVIEHIRSLLRKDVPSITEVHLNAVCREAVDLMRRDAGSRGIRLDLSLDPRVPNVAGHPIEFQQVVLNLLLNALDAAATSSAERWVAVSTRVMDGRVELVVRDSGPGFSPEIRDRLFESFFTTKAHGLGMGLVIARSIVGRQGGRIDAESGDGGAIFRVRLPMVGDRAGEARPQQRVGREADTIASSDRRGTSSVG